jgi:dolichol-phosphate mannosyltransferase
LVLPITPGTVLRAAEIVQFRQILEERAGLQSLEVVVVRGSDIALESTDLEGSGSDDPSRGPLTCVSAEASDWPTLVRAGLEAASGDHLVVLDVNRHYSPQSLVPVLAAVREGEADLAIAVPERGRLVFAEWVRSWPAARFISRWMLGTSDVFSGLFALRRSIGDLDMAPGAASRSNLVLHSLMRRQPRCIDVPVSVDHRFQPGRMGINDVRAVKRILDSRFGNYSRLVQFCMVGASGMVIDLSFYALLQFLLSFTWLADHQSALFDCSWHLAVAAAVSIGTALVWNFTLNRRLTFNDSDKGALLPQFFTYVFSNAVAIVLSFSVRLYLPAHVDFFARHRLAAAVVGIVAATGISFSMARWLVFARRPELQRTPHFPLEPSMVHQPTSVP